MSLAALRKWKGLLWLPAFAGMALTGCRREDSPPVNPNSLVDCRPVGASAFAHECTVERTQGPDGTILTLRHPDGGFRRLLVTGNGQGVTAADGAEPAEVRMSGSKAIEVSLAGDRYRLPATPKAPAAK